MSTSILVSETQSPPLGQGLRLHISFDIRLHVQRPERRVQYVHAEFFAMLKVFEFRQSIFNC